MKLDRDKAGKAFRNYVAQYNAQDEKVKLKIDHTYRVAALCEQIAQSISLSSDDVDIAWFSGLLHDVQWTRKLSSCAGLEHLMMHSL